MATQESKLIGRNYTPAAKSLLKRSLIMGIDPGFSGAIAVVELESNKIIDMIDMPLFQTPSAARKQGFLSHLDVHKLSSLIDSYVPYTSLAVLEEPGAMPKQGLSSTFRFGHTCGQIHGVLAGHYLPVFPVKPGPWKVALGLSSEKDESRALATKEFPEFKHLWELKKHNDRAEAALLTVYGKRYLGALLKLGL